MRNLRFILLITSLFLITTSYAEQSTKWQSPEFVNGAESISLQQAKKLHAEGIRFFDVRSARQYNKRHIPGAINLYINGGFSEANLLTHVTKETPFVLYCNGTHCSLSSNASRKAVAWGFTQIKYFREGAKGWRLDGNPLEYGS